MNREQRRHAAKHMAAESTKYPPYLVMVPEYEWPSAQPLGLKNVWRSRDYMVQVFDASHPSVFARMTVNRVGIDSKVGWKQDIPWEDLQRLKSECGFGQLDAVEVYPSDMDVVNVANMRHLWILSEPLPFAWRKRCADQA